MRENISKFPVTFAFMASIIIVLIVKFINKSRIAEIT